MFHSNRRGYKLASKYSMMDSFDRIVIVFRSKIYLRNLSPICSLMINTDGVIQSKLSVISKRVYMNKPL